MNLLVSKVSTGSWEGLVRFTKRNLDSYVQVPKYKQLVIEQSRSAVGVNYLFILFCILRVLTNLHHLIVMGTSA